LNCYFTPKSLVSLIVTQLDLESKAITISNGYSFKLSLSYGPPWAHYLGGYQDRLLGGPLGLPDLCRTVPDGVRRKDFGGGVLR
jgi:hypothetical protein